MRRVLRICGMCVQGAREAEAKARREEVERRAADAPMAVGVSTGISPSDCWARRPFSSQLAARWLRDVNLADDTLFHSIIFRPL